MKQPWAWAIVHGGKDVENRTRNIAGEFRGVVAIHAGLAWDQSAETSDQIIGALCATNYIDAPIIEARGYVEPDDEEFAPRGYVIGVADLVDVHHDTPDGPPSEACWDAGCTISGPDVSWAQVGAWHLVLRNPRPLVTPVPARGFLGLWTLPEDVEARVREQVSL